MEKKLIVLQSSGRTELQIILIEINLIKLIFLEKVFRLVIRLTHYFILSLLFIITNVVVSTANDNKGKYYQSLSKDWRSIFPDGNRNAAGPKFYKHISDKYKNFSEFKENLSQVLVEKIHPITSEIKKLSDNKDFLDKILLDGKKKAENIASNKLKKMQEIVGF